MEPAPDPLVDVRRVFGPAPDNYVAEAKRVAEQLATAEQQMSANAAFKLERTRLREVAKE